MSDIIGGLGIGLTGNLLNFALGLNREEIAANRQYSMSEQAADNADRRTRKLYSDFMSPDALLQQYKQAGLSPSLMFGGGGVGGQTPSGAQGAGSHQGSTFTPIDPMTGAQLELIKAEANKANAEAETIKGDNARGKAEIEQLIADTENTKIQTEYTRVQANIAKIDEAIAEATKGNRIEISDYELRRTVEDVNYLVESTKGQKLSNKVNEETLNDQIQQVRTETYRKVIECKLIQLESELKEEQISLTQSQIQDIASQIATRADEIQIKAHEYELNRQNTEFNWNIETSRLVIETEMKLKELGVKKAEIATRIATTLTGAVLLKH